MDIMDKGYAPGTQIDIIGHSMGGLIARELLRIHRENLQDNYQVDIGRVITLGTPHEGSYIAHETIPAQLVVWLFSWIGPNWDSILFDSFDPDSDFLTTLNENPSSYSNDIEWTTISGRDNFLGEILSYFHGGHNDIFVAEWSAHLSFAVPYYIGSINHEGLLTDPSNGDEDRPFDVVANELGPEIDSDVMV
jgi:pimeloyl-ACP methyl ester carboxylesterase